MALYRSPDYQTSSESIGLSVQKNKFIIDFQDGGHFGLTLATSDLQVDTANEISSQFAFWFWIKKFKTDVQQGC